MRRTLLIVALLPCLALLAGCAGHDHRASQTDYQTVGKYPRRDADEARREDEAALRLIAKGDYPAAEQALRRALAADVMFGPAHNNLGNVYYHESQLYSAAWEFQYAIKLMPHQPEPRNNLGRVFEAAGKIDQAVDAYEQAIKVEPDNPQFVGNCARARVRRGESGDEVRQLLTKVAAYDTRPAWVNWARERLILMKEPATQATPRW